MPLSEFLRMARGKLQAVQQRPTPFDPSLSRTDNNELVELVWENGQIMMQGQSSRVARSPTLDNLPSSAPRDRDAGLGNATNPRIGKFGVLESILNDISPIVPSGDLDLSQEEEMAPWFTYHMDDAIPQDYCSDLLPEISGVTANGMSSQSSYLPAAKRNGSDQIVSNFQNDGKAASSKARFSSSWLPQVSDPRVSDISSSKNPEGIYGNSVPAIDSKMERQNSSNLLNFSHFSRPATLVKANGEGMTNLPSSGLKRPEVEEKGAVSSCSNPNKSSLTDRLTSMEKDIDFLPPSAAIFETVTSQAPPTKPKDSFPAVKPENLCRQASSKNEKPLVIGERAVEPMVASSSVGSGNSADRGSYENAHNSKRKFCDLEESECRSHDIETESAGGKKAANARGGNGSKRSRAAEVHNLSERRRRDRINEKMRALQELIPNCNKADKASMLDEAIEYLKTLQLQVQIMSMGAGLCMPSMMFQHMHHPAHMPHFSPMGVGMGMGMGMGFGMGMVDMNGGSLGCPVPPMQGAHFTSPMPGPANFPRIPVYGHPGQGLPNSMPRPPLVHPTAQPSVTSAMDVAPSKNSEDSITNKNPNPEANQLQATNEVLDQSTENKQAAEATDISKETGQPMP